MNRIERQLGQGIKRKRKTTKEQDDFIEEVTSNEFLDSTQIKCHFEKQYSNSKISRSIIVRRPKERKFKYKKLKRIQKLSDVQKYTRYYFSTNMIENYFLDLPLIVFSDECRFANDPDNRQHWIQSCDFRERRCAQHSKYTFPSMVWGDIGFDFKSNLVFPKGKINEYEYRYYLNKSNIFEEADEAYHGKFKWIFQQDEATPPYD